MKKLISNFAVVVVVACSVMASSRDSLAEVKVGSPYPDFVLPRIDDRKPVTLSDYRGKRVLLIQFASW